MDRSVGSPRTRSVVGVRGPGVSVFGLPPSALGYLITANFRTLRVSPLRVLASCLPRQILNCPSNLFTHFDEKAQEFTKIA